MSMVMEMSSTELLGAISSMLDGRFEKNNEKLIQVIDERFKEQDETIEKRFKEQDETIEKRFKEQDEAIEKRFKEQDEAIEKRFKEQDVAIEKRLEERDRNLINSLIDEIDLVQEKANNHFERIEKRLSNLEKAFWARRTDLEYRVSELERKLSC